MHPQLLTDCILSDYKLYWFSWFSIVLNMLDTSSWFFVVLPRILPSTIPTKLVHMAGPRWLVSGCHVARRMRHSTAESNFREVKRSESSYDHFLVIFGKCLLSLWLISEHVEIYGYKIGTSTRLSNINKLGRGDHAGQILGAPLQDFVDTQFPSVMVSLGQGWVMRDSVGSCW